MKSAPLHVKRKKPVSKEIRVALPPGKSLWARVLILYAIHGKTLPKPPAGAGDDVYALYNSLEDIRRGKTEIDVVESGTAMRFLTAYLAAVTRSAVMLKGRGRQYQRPIGPLVDTLRGMGAKITYAGSEGYPPLLIEPSTLRGGEVDIDAGHSSQFVSALLLISPLFEEGLKVNYAQKTMQPSEPYIRMTEELLQKSFEKELPDTPGIERDWTAASALYALCALSHIKVKIPGLQAHSLQGDADVLVELYEKLGVKTLFDEEGVTLRCSGKPRIPYIEADFEQTPDIVPNVVVTCLGLKIPFCFTGVARLRLKESDRIVALQHNASQAGFRIGVSTDMLSYDGTATCNKTDIPVIDPMGDHRIAMAFGLLAFKLPDGIVIRDSEVVSKSWPGFWHALEPVWQLEHYIKKDKVS